MLNAKKPSRVVQEKSCGVLVFRPSEQGREYLVLHYPSGHWDFPKGHVEEFDRDEEATALRELAEETSLIDVKIKEGFKDKVYYEFDRGKKERVQKTVIFFIAKSNESSIELSHEHQDFLWLSYEEARSKVTFKNAKDLLKRAEDFLKSVS